MCVYIYIYINIVYVHFSNLSHRVNLGVPDRAARRLFSTGVLRSSPTKFAEISQKVLSATACRYMIFWLCNLLHAMGGDDEPSLCLGSLIYLEFPKCCVFQNNTQSGDNVYCTPKVATWPDGRARYNGESVFEF